MDYKLTVLVSLYKSGKFIKHFLKQIKKQTIFSEIEWYFIDANSPDNEYELLLEEQKKHKNIKNQKHKNTREKREKEQKVRKA